MHYRIATGESIERVAHELGRKISTLRRHLENYTPEVHPMAPDGSIVVKTAGGATISGLSLTQLIKLARAL